MQGATRLAMIFSFAGIAQILAPVISRLKRIHVRFHPAGFWRRRHH